jgi:hypothetical protein
LQLAKQGIDLQDESAEVKSMVDAMFFSAYGNQLIDPRTGRLALDPRTLQSHYGKVVKLIQDSHESYHQRKLKNKDEKIRAAEGVAPEKGSGPTVSEIKPQHYTKASEILAIAAKTGKSVKEVTAEIDEKFLA